MKKLFSTLLTLVFVLSMGTVAMATENTPTQYEDMKTITLEKEYILTNPGTLSPAETFTFTIERTSVSDAGAGIDATDMPIPTIGTVAYAKGEAGSVTRTKEITITLPDYTSVGIYTYTINEVTGDKAGVTYYDSPIKLVVTVIEQDGKVRVGAIHTEAKGEQKNDNFPNEYSAGDLEFSKEVTGNLGDKAKYFDVTVTLTGVEDMIYEESYPVTGGSHDDNPTAIAVGTPETFKIKDGETIKIANLPYGVTYTVVETDYRSEGYLAAQYNFSDSDNKIDSVIDTVGITNNKNADVDTGISLDSIPYIMILGLAVLGISGLFLKRRRNADF